MFDLYRLPADFPGRAESGDLHDPFAKAAFLEEQLSRSISEQRFIPYVQLHEFEALLFADAEKLSFFYPDQSHQVRRLVEMAKGFDNPELINEGPETAPSKRIIRELPSYAGDKAVAGPEVATQIGLARMRERCPHFNQWLSILEGLPG